MLPLPDDLKKKYLTEDGNALRPEAPTFVPDGWEPNGDELNRIEHEILLGNTLNYDDCVYLVKSFRSMMEVAEAAQADVAMYELVMSLSQLGNVRAVGL